MSSAIPPVEDDLSTRFGRLRTATEGLEPTSAFLRQLSHVIDQHVPNPRALLWTQLEQRSIAIVVASSVLTIPLLLLNVALYQQLPDTVAALLWDVLK